MGPAAHGRRGLRCMRGAVLAGARAKKGLRGRLALSAHAPGSHAALPSSWRPCAPGRRGRTACRRQPFCGMRASSTGAIHRVTASRHRVSALVGTATCERTGGAHPGSHAARPTVPPLPAHCLLELQRSCSKQQHAATTVGSALCGCCSELSQSLRVLVWRIGYETNTSHTITCP